MKVLLYISTLSLMLSLTLSCSGKLYTVNQAYIEQIYENEEIAKTTFDLVDFDFYIFNICEKYEGAKLEERFCECPDDFYEISEKQKLKKLEEVYLLFHKELDLVLYITTFSHKYIYEDQSGFLNDKAIYANSMILADIEYVYVGREVPNEHLIQFIGHGKHKDISLHYKRLTSDKLMIDKVKIPTAENNYSTKDFINTEGVFKNDLNFKKNKNYKVYYSKEKKNEITSFQIIDKRNSLEILSQINDVLWFKIPRKRIPYQPKFNAL